MGTRSRVQTKCFTIGFALLSILICLQDTASRAWAQERAVSCVDPSGLAGSVVSIVRYFDKPRRNAAGEEIFGERATAWFYTSPRLLVTAAHFARELSSQDWQVAELRQASRDGEPGPIVNAQPRLLARGQPADDRGGGAGPTTAPAVDVAILELRVAFPNAQVLDIQPEVPVADAPVLVLGYPVGRLQAAHGIILEPRDSRGKFAGLTLLEVKGNNRLLLDGGTSGAPVLDCREGRVVAVLHGLLRGPSLPFLPAGRSIVPTAWGRPTNTAVPAATLAAITSRLP